MGAAPTFQLLKVPATNTLDASGAMHDSKISLVPGFVVVLAGAFPDALRGLAEAFAFSLIMFVLMVAWVGEWDDSLPDQALHPCACPRGSDADHV